MARFTSFALIVAGLACAASAPARTVDIDQVAANAAAIASHSWEYGAVTQALVELYAPTLSPFSGAGSIPPPTHGKASTIPDAVWSIVNKIMANVTDTSTVLIDGDGAAGDPASVGPAVQLANTVEKSAKWAGAVERQLDHLLFDVPRSPDGGISQREDQVQFWADFVYMVPPFLAYYGALEGGKNGTALLREAHKQCEVYRAALFDPDPGLWRHIVFGNGELPQHWATGNAWAAYGMARVLVTIRAMPHAVVTELADEQTDLVQWIDEILVGAYRFQHPNGTLYNYIDQPANQTFADSAGTALIAAATYRLASVTRNLTHIPRAEKAYQLITENIDKNGWVLDAVDPLTFDTPLAPGNHSPEAQAFTVMLEAARDAFNRGST